MHGFVLLYCAFLLFYWFDSLRFLDADGLVVGFKCHYCQYFFDGGDKGIAVSVKQPVWSSPGGAGEHRGVFLWDQHKEAVVCQVCFNKGLNSGAMKGAYVHQGFVTVCK
jgi:hypothetical protein